MFRPLTGDFTLGRKRNGQKERVAAAKRRQRGLAKQNNQYFGEMQRGLRKETDNPKYCKHKRRGTILGMMHASKLELWVSLTRSCPMWYCEQVQEYQ
jgi:hypothetical protein